MRRFLLFGVWLTAVLVLTWGSAAVATHVFDDVDDDRFYADAVEWAAANGITTGRTPTIFDPDGAVTRGESITFLKRYNDFLSDGGVVGMPLTRVVLVDEQVAGVPANGGEFSILMVCPEGATVLGGGFQWPSVITANVPTTDPDTGREAWRLEGRNEETFDGFLTGWAVCLEAL